MENFSYDPTSPESIRLFAEQLTYKSLADCVRVPEEENTRDRGNLGTLVEKYFFNLTQNNKSAPDFPAAGVELKTTGVLKSGDSGYKAKERLVLKMIDFKSLVGETWETSSLMRKCNLMLLLFYLYVQEVPVTERKFILPPMLFRFPDADLPQLRRDWEFIQNKIKEGKAHELSEGDTFYLGACRKGPGGPNETGTPQPFSPVLAKSRAFSLKQAYVTQIIQGHAQGQTLLGVTGSVSFEEATEKRFKRYLGKPTDEITASVGIFRSSPTNKGFHRGLATQILLDGDIRNSELLKAGIELKTVRTDERGKPREHMSFPAFSFTGIVDENWEDSTFFQKLESKFLFVVFQTGADGVERLNKVFYWNMPFADREQARRVWEETKNRLVLERTDFPRAKENPVAHVRPKARNAADTAPTHFGSFLTKRCFWLNNTYVAEVVLRG
ncbi:MAG: Sau3AI family type II restriction endonuclease [Microbacteriaceae bacterium]